MTKLRNNRKRNEDKVSNETSTAIGYCLSLTSRVHWVFTVIGCTCEWVYYVGTMLTDGNEVEAWINKEAWTATSFSKHLNNKNPSRNLKRTIYNTIIRSVRMWDMDNDVRSSKDFLGLENRILERICCRIKVLHGDADLQEKWETTLDN